MKTRLALLAAAAALIVPQVGSAHHSFAMFDNAKTVTISGTMKEFQWANPHVWVQVMVPGASGKAEEWSVEGGSPNILSRQGWRKTALVPGQKVTVKIHPLKSGANGGSLMSVTLPDGKVLGAGPGGPGGPGGPPGGGPGGPGGPPPPAY